MKMKVVNDRTSDGSRSIYCSKHNKRRNSKKKKTLRTDAKLIVLVEDAGIAIADTVVVSVVNVFVRV